MKTRVGKIARLPHDIREELNQRLFNGAMGPELTRWLNQLPAVQEVLAKFFNASPVNRQNLTEWRHGGYEDWLRHQDRELRIQRISEEGLSLERHKGKAENDSFEHSALIALAELMTDIDSLHQLDGDKRWERLRNLTLELSRLQNSYNRSRWAALAWAKWNDRFLGPEDYGNDREETRQPDQNPAADSSPTDKIEPRAPSQQAEIKPNQTTSTEGRVDDIVRVKRVIYHRKGCGCVCRTCHPETGDYPYAEAIRDTTGAKEYGAQCFWREEIFIITIPTECDCPCDECEQPDLGRVGAAAPPHIPSHAHSVRPTPENNPTHAQPAIGPICPPSPIEITRLDPVADFLRQVARRKSAQCHENENTL